jgi:methylmalonyl-CoA mutase N-terminal domain/subunit
MFPGEFPYTAGIYPFKREGEDPTRMFAGEGGPERTNKRFHYVSKGLPAKRLSTAFDSVTLYMAMIPIIVRIFMEKLVIQGKYLLFR